MLQVERALQNMCMYMCVDMRARVRVLSICVKMHKKVVSGPTHDQKNGTVNTAAGGLPYSRLLLFD